MSKTHNKTHRRHVDPLQNTVFSIDLWSSQKPGTTEKEMLTYSNTKWSGWKKCLVQCLVQALDGLVRDFLDGWTIRGPMSRGLGQLRKQELAIHVYIY